MDGDMHHLQATVLEHNLLKERQLHLVRNCSTS